MFYTCIKNIWFIQLIGYNYYWTSSDVRLYCLSNVLVNDRFYVVQVHGKTMFYTVNWVQL